MAETWVITVELVIAAFLCFYGLFQIPEYFQYFRAVVFGVTLLCFFTVGYLTYRHNQGKKPYTKRPFAHFKETQSKRVRIFYAGIFSLICCEAVALVSFSFLIWRIDIIHGQFVFTINNLLSIGMFLLGVWIGRYLGLQLSDSLKERRKRKKQPYASY